VDIGLVMNEFSTLFVSSLFTELELATNISEGTCLAKIESILVRVFGSPKFCGLDLSPHLGRVRIEQAFQALEKSNNILH
jgi:hypothetical protein